jgi:GT2 family glycosyltransferase
VLAVPLSPCFFVSGDGENGAQRVSAVGTRLMPLEPPPVTAVILNYNGRALLEIILPSLATQHYPNMSTVVVDNGSVDDSLEYLAERWPDIEVIAIPDNVGVAAALNRGVRAASGEFVALLNNDLELEPDWLREMVAGLTRHPEAASVACKLRSYHDRARIDGTGDVLTRWLACFPRGRGELDERQFEKEEETLTATAGAALYRLSAFAEVGLFDESFWAYFEDVDWGLRAQLAGLRSWYVPNAVAYHMGGATTGGDRDPFYAVLHERNRIGLMIKDLPLSVLRRNARVILIDQTLSLVYAVRKRKLRVYFRARLGVLWHLPGWLAQRWRIQSGRRVPASRIQELLSD